MASPGEKSGRGGEGRVAVAGMMAEEGYYWSTIGGFAFLACDGYVVVLPVEFWQRGGSWFLHVFLVRGFAVQG